MGLGILKRFVQQIKTKATRSDRYRQRTGNRIEQLEERLNLSYSPLVALDFRSDSALTSEESPAETADGVENPLSVNSLELSDQAFFPTDPILNPPPAITSLSANLVPAVGGTLITIFGNHFSTILSDNSQR